MTLRSRFRTFQLLVPRRHVEEQLRTGKTLSCFHNPPHTIAPLSKRSPRKKPRNVRRSTWSAGRSTRLSPFYRIDGARQRDTGRFGVGFGFRTESSSWITTRSLHTSHRGWPHRSHAVSVPSSKPAASLASTFTRSRQAARNPVTKDSAAVAPYSRSVKSKSGKRSKAAR
jgi:hypothetical protein